MSLRTKKESKRQLQSDILQQISFNNESDTANYEMKNYTVLFQRSLWLTSASYSIKHYATSTQPWALRHGAEYGCRNPWRGREMDPPLGACGWRRFDEGDAADPGLLLFVPLSRADDSKSPLLLIRNKKL